MPSKTLCPFIIYDFETSGLSSKKNSIVEVAMIALAGDTLQEIGRYEAKVEYAYNKTHIYEDRALTINGHTIESLINEGEKIEVVVAGMIDLLEKANKATIGKYQKPILVGHNIQDFDNDFLIATFLHCRKEKELSKLLTGRTDHHGNFQPAAIDTLHLSRIKWQDDETMNDFKLATVIEKSGLELPDAHRAMNDVLANKDLFVAFVNDMRVDNSGTGMMGRKLRIREHFQF